MRVILVLAVLLLVMPVATAQTAPQGCGPISFSGKVASSAASIAAGAEGDVSVVVQNANSAQVASVVVSAATTSPGWSITTADQTINVPVSNGQAKATFHVVASKDAKADLAINFSATATCTGPGGQACPSLLAAQCVSGPINTSGVVPLGAQSGFSFPGFSNIDFPIEYVIAAIVLVALAVAIPLLIRKRKPAFAADCPEPLKMVRPGRGTSFPIDIRNPGNEALTAQFEVGAVPEGWSAFMPLPEIQLAPREARSLWLMVRAPATAATGSTADVEIRLRNAQKPESSTVVKVRAEVNPDAAEGGPKSG